MRTRFSKLLLALAVLVALTGAACAHEPRVVLHTSGGDVAVDVEVAATPERRSLGLMYRRDLAADAGMLFIFDSSEPLNFWMKNTPLPLDMIFIGQDRHVVGIVKDATPFTTTPRGVGKPSRYVLEVNAGFSNRNGLNDGDAVSFDGVPGIGAAAP